MFNGCSLKGTQKDISIDEVELNPDNPRTPESQVQNAQRLAAVFAGPIGYDSSQPIVVVSSADSVFRVIKGNGRIGGACILATDDPVRYTEVFGKAGKIPAIVLDCPSAKEIAIVMSDHNGVDAREQSLYEQYLSVANCVHAGLDKGEKASREFISTLHGKAASWAQAYIYMVRMADELAAMTPEQLAELPNNPLDVFISEALQKADSSKLRIGHQKSLYTFWSDSGITADNADFWNALDCLRKYGKTITSDSVPPNTKEKAKKDAAFHNKLAKYTPVSATLQRILDALGNRSLDDLQVIDTELLEAEHADTVDAIA